jgi:N-acetylmuramoyl-L-alanine amidase
MRLPGRFAPAVLIIAAGCSGALEIRDRAIPFTDARIEMTRAYAAERYGLEDASIRIEPKIVVLHWTAIATLEDSYGAFVHESLPGRPELRGAGAVNVAIQFLVDRDGTVYRLMPETWMARHVIGLNHSAIGVENVGGTAGDDMTAAQIEANSRLVRYLVGKYPGIEYLIGHHEYREFEGHPLWLESDPSYRTEKVDPGDRFMNSVRRRTADLALKGVAEIRAERS